MKKYVIATLACILLILAYVVEQKDVVQKRNSSKQSTTISNSVT
ncbi:hypothetical protein [Spongiivirga citrea]|nr:hypothetical protein [Spongiivirga citrea]